MSLLINDEPVTSRPTGVKKDIPPQERLILALDVPTADAAKRLVERLGDSVSFYKLGLQLFMAEGYFDLISWLRKREKEVFVDLKFFDVPETVKSAVQQLKHREVTFATVHGNENMLKAAVTEKNGLKILAVTVLTSLDQNDIRDLGFQCSIEEVVLSRAKRAIAAGCDGVISSALEVERIRAELGDGFLIVTPGIRPGFNELVSEIPQDDQKRTATIEEAFRSGADYIVVGRPIRNAADPRRAAEEIQTRIRSIFLE